MLNFLKTEINVPVYTGDIYNPIVDFCFQNKTYETDFVSRHKGKQLNNQLARVSEQFINLFCAPQVAV